MPPQLYNMNNPGKAINLGSFTPLGNSSVYIRYENNQFIVTGKGASVNGQPVENWVLQHGDIICAGDCQYFFNDEDDTSGVLAGEDSANIKGRQMIPKTAKDFIRDVSSSASATRTISTLYSVSHVISQILDLEPLLNKILELVFKVLPADKGSILLNKNGKLVPVAAMAKGTTLSPEEVKVSQSIIDEAVKSREALLVVDAQSDARLTGASIAEQNITSAMCIPIIRKEKLLGVLQVDVTSGDRAFTSDELHLLTGIGMQAGLAMENALLYQAVRERERIEHEVKLASEIQRQLLPKHKPVLDGIEVAGFMTPAREIGGDYYDFIEGNDKHYFTIGDVSGKGVPAGIIMAMIRSFLRSLIDFNLSVRENIIRTNNFFCDNVERGKFMSLLLLEWSNKEKKLRYSSAGHEFIVFYHAAEKRCEAVKAGGVVLGLKKGLEAPYKLLELDIKPGDALVLYTDGVTEAMNKNREEYKLERLVDLVGKIAHGRSAEEIIQKILEDCKSHMGDYPQMDDITLMVFKCLEC